MTKAVLTFFALVFLSFLSHSQKNAVKGQIVDSISVQGSEHESFALYLPKSYDEGAKNGIIFIFEPGARGRMGLLPFLDSSEEYGLILVCSNNSRNGSYQRSFEIAERLFAHVFTHYQVDKDKMFLSGFSGGSRLATAIAVLSDQFIGVIACGAGFPPNPSQIPSFQKFHYAAICGLEDMNYHELLNNKSYLDRLGFVNTLISFQGGHKWPHRTEIDRAIDWLFLQRRKSTGNHNVDATLKSMFVKDYNSTIQLERQNEPLLAKENYERLLNSYPKSLGLDSIRKKESSLLKSKSFKAASKQLSEALELEEKIKKRLFNRMESDFKNVGAIDFKWWKKEFGKLDKITARDSREMTRMVTRVKFGFLASIYERRYANPELAENPDYNSLLKEFQEILYQEKG